MFGRCLLHIGMEKTGTTSIQAMFAANRGVLVRQGWFYSTAMGRENHERLVVYARDDDTSDNQRKRALARGLTLAEFRAQTEALLAEEARAHPGHSLILSNEHLQSRLTTLAEKQRLLQLLRSVCSGEIRVLLYLRRQDLAATSLHGTRLLSGGKADPGRILPALQPGSAMAYFFDYERIVAEYVEAFGAGAVAVRVFEKDRLQGGDVRADILDWIGLPQPAALTWGPRRNESVSRAAQFFMARMNQVNPTFHGTQPNPLRGKVDKRAIRLFAGGEGFRPARADAEAFYERFRAGNARLFASLGQPGFSESFEDYPETADTAVDAGAVAEVGVRLFMDVMAELNELRAELARQKGGAPPPPAGRDDEA